jgi:hypothetical protein
MTRICALLLGITLASSGCIAGDATPADEVPGESHEVALGVTTGDGSTIVKYVAATAQTQAELGVVKWRITLQSNGSVFFEGLKASGHVDYWQRSYTSGGGGNPWRIHETNETFLAARADRSETYAQPTDQPWKWDEAQRVATSIVRDVNAALGRNPVPALATSGTGAMDTAWDCATALASYALAVGSTALSVVGTDLRCAQALLPPFLPGIGDCASGLAADLSYARIAIGALQAVAPACPPSGPPPAPVSPTPPPGGGTGSDTYFHFHDSDPGGGNQDYEFWTTPDPSCIRTTICTEVAGVTTCWTDCS